MKFTILTPTTGNSNLVKLLRSIEDLVTNDDITISHYLVVDGPEFSEKVKKIVKSVPSSRRNLVVLPENTGASGFLGHRIYASFPYLINSDYIIFCDDDNWFEPNHILNYYNLIKTGNYDWVYSLRRIVDHLGNYICNDDCESLGYLSNCFYNRDVYLIDTNCTCVRTSICQQLCSIWNKPGSNGDSDPDRLYSRTLMEKFQNYECTLDYTLNYTIGNRPRSVKADLFINGNSVFNKLFGGRIDWRRRQIFLVHFTPEQTERIIRRIYSTEKPDISYNQWQLNILDKMTDKLVISAYNPFIPSNKKVLVHMFTPNTLPASISRLDLFKIYYTIEGPNVRHQAQWDLEFITKNFNKILTYWKPLLLSDKCQFFPFIHRFDFYNENDILNIKKNSNIDKKIGIILENRGFNAEYSINGVKLRSLDYLRGEYAKHLGKRIYCYGETWRPLSNIINYCEAKNRFLDQERVVDIMSKYTFVLIIENCDASGYVSEKIYDALSVGCIPLYYGNVNSLINIPKSCYIDLRDITPSQLPVFIDNMDLTAIETMREEIYNCRVDILYGVSINKYNSTISSLL
jgi:hypothetical protein